MDDDEGIRETLVDVFADDGLVAVTAENGAVALSYLLSSQSLPRVIVLDLMMPVMGGVEFREKQLAHPSFARIPVIVMSASDTGRATASRMNADAFLPKPPTMTMLLDVVRRFY